MTDIVERLRVWPAAYGEDAMSSTYVGEMAKNAADEIERLRKRIGPRGLEVVDIDGAGHYVNEKVKAEIERLRKALDPFVRVAEVDIGQDETDADIFQPMRSGYNRAPLITVGDMRRAVLVSPANQGCDE